MRAIRVLKTMRMAVLGAALLASAGCGRAVPAAQAQGKTAKQQSKPARPSHPAQIPLGPAGEKIRLGQRIFDQTPRYAAPYVGNQMNCADCHLQGGREPYSAPLVGVPEMFPAYSQRAGRTITLAERIQECFVRSENGRPPAAGDRVMAALLAYMDWLSQGHPKGTPYPGRGLVDLPQLHGDAARGATLYAQQCSVCHGDQGAGMPPIFPPLWGPASFNDGAGMSGVQKMAKFVQHNMPQNAPGSLSPQQAYDLAAYIEGKPRPKMNPAYTKY